MNNASTLADTLVKDHLLVRGYGSTFRSFEKDIKNFKESRIQVESFVEETMTSIEKLDIDKLSTLWSFWSSRVFNNLSGERLRVAKQYETDAYRLFLVRSFQKKDIAKCSEFFQKMSAQTQNNPAWVDWFAFPYNPNPQDSPLYRKYFDNNWKDIFIVSLHNFLSIAVQLAQRTQLTQLVEAAQLDEEPGTSLTYGEELIDDFAVIAQCSGPMKTSQSKPSLKNLLKSITGGKRTTSD